MTEPGLIEDTPQPEIVEGSQLRTMRRRLGLSHESLAEALGVSDDTIRRWEKQHEAKPVAFYALIGLAYARRARS